MRYCVQIAVFRERKDKGCMVNEERLRCMIKMAEFDSQDGKDCKPMMQYARKDYVSLQLLKSFVGGSIAFFLLGLLWALYSMEELMEKINSLDILQILVTTAVLYVIFMIIYLAATYIIFHVKYTNGRRKVKQYYVSLKKINTMYTREERLRVNGNKDWE